MKILYILLINICFLTQPLAARDWTVGFLTGSGGLGDESFNDMSWAGLAKARQECGFTLLLREWEQEMPMDELFLQLVGKGSDMVVLNGDQFTPLIEKYSPKYPQIKFIANDFDGGDYQNLKSIRYDQHEGAFLAGALAALHSKTGKVGFIGAIDISVIKAFQVGYAQGVRHISPDTEVMVRHISTLPDYSGFSNPHLAFQIATSLYESGVDVIFSVAGMSGNGVIRAAETSRKFVIGVDANQDHMAKGYVLTSVMKRLDRALYEETRQACQNQFVPGDIHYGLKNSGISLTPMKFTQDVISKEVREKLKQLQNDIIMGNIVVIDYLESSH